MLDVADTWSQQQDNYDGIGPVEKVWNSSDNYSYGKLTKASIFHIASENGWKKTPQKKQNDINSKENNSVTEESIITDYKSLPSEAIEIIESKEILTAYEKLHQFNALKITNISYGVAKYIVVRVMNDELYFILNGKGAIAKKCWAMGGEMYYDFFSPSDLTAIFANVGVIYKNDTQNDKRLKEHGEVSPIKAWITSRSRNNKNYIYFHPLEQRKGGFNLFRGLNVKRIKGTDKIERYLNHAKEIICSGNDDDYTYLMTLLANWVQFLHIKPTQAIILKSKELGTGKTIFAKGFAKIFGQHSIAIQKPKQLVGQFNGHLSNKLFVHVEEAFHGHKSSSDELKTTITEESINIERKGIDIIELESYHRFMFCTNNDRVVVVDIDERRYFMPEVSPKYRATNPGSYEYHKKLREDVNHPDFAGQLLNYLMEQDPNAVNIHIPRRTQALHQQILTTLKPELQFIKEFLSKAFIFDSAQERTITIEPETRIKKKVYINHIVIL